MTKQTWTAAVAALLFVALAAVIAMAPVPFVSWTPGATYDLLGEVNEAPAIEITGADTYPATGELRMVTVAVTSPDSSLTLPEALFSYWLPAREVLPREAVYRPGIGTEAIEENETQLMDDSQGAAVVAALRAAGVAVRELPMVETVSAAGPSAGKLMPGDLITAVDSTKVLTKADVRAAIDKHKVGDAVKFDLIRERVDTTETVTTRSQAEDPSVPVVGIGLGTGYTYAPQITFGINTDIGGSSAGLPFSLAIYQKLTADDLLDGRVVAATGTIDASGHIGAIGAVQEKIAAASRDGATVFLLPRDNCVDVTEAHDGIRLVPVETLGDALAGLADLDDPARAADVPECP
ncbi:MAG: PDZ domain-containing protein [Propionicimonas sp.]|uniref:YlbL family protein n=1 Tax=Propionicimonas sp. TaxID=1955623 RepID=UPI002B1F9D32|nr:PDZ domain-containing protein [Propionicimonas sp.]MEA4944140.1 PDZ domain-containing protein [Propionicimonas sp.]MEA5055723.1 PDZ domain-containing protein [Propionicimonas sp.]MEA5117422.1 PDZ domain-containing protein [Propionicimonas sp.]